MNPEDVATLEAELQLARLKVYALEREVDALKSVVALYRCEGTAMETCPVHDGAPMRPRTWRCDKCQERHLEREAEERKSFRVSEPSGG